MIAKIFRSIKQGYLLIEIYERTIVIFSIISGKLKLLFYRIIFNKRLQIGKDIKFFGALILRIHKNAFVSIGENSILLSDNFKSALPIKSVTKIICFYEGEVVIGKNVAISGSTISCRSTSIRVGEGSLIAPNCVITDSNFHAKFPPENRCYNLDLKSDKPIIINKNVWIGMNSIILKGTVIGENSIIGAGSVVTGEVLPNSIYAGNPAIFIKKINE